MSRESFSYTHGDRGSAPSNPLDFKQNGRPGAQNFDWFWYNVTKAISGHASEFDRLDSNDDGIVDAADGASTWSEAGTEKAVRPTDINLTGDITVSSDGVGGLTIGVTTFTGSDARAAVDGANVDIVGDADTLDGNDASAFSLSGHDHDSRYIKGSGDTMGASLSLGGYSLNGVGVLNGDGGSLRLDFNDGSNQLDVEDQNGNPANLAAADLYVGDGIGWLSNAVNAGGARTAVDGANVDISGDADSVDGLHSGDIAKLYDGVQLPTYSSLSNVPAMSKGEMVFVDGDGAYVEDGT
jgi:hypothetical protein